MTSFLPVCLALLLPACVLGRNMESWIILKDECTSPEHIRNMNECTNQIVTYSELTLSLFSSTKEWLCGTISYWVYRMDCLNEVWRNCVNGERLDLLLTRSSLNNSLHYLCDNMDDDDFECLLWSVYRCLRKTYSGKMTTPLDRTCRLIDFVGTCAHVYCEATEGRSMEVYNIFWTKLFSHSCSISFPSSSSSSSDSSSSSSSFTLILTAWAVLPAMMAARISSDVIHLL